MPVIIDGTNGVSTPNTFAFKNRLINAQLLINQRGVSGTVSLSAGAYGHDRFKAGASGCTYTFSTTNNVTTLTISAGSLQQVIEGLNLESGTYTLSWTGTAQGKIGAGSYGASGITGSITGGTNTTIEFNTGTLSLPQLEVGSTATSFDYRPYTTELQLCQRYCYAQGWVNGGATYSYAVLGTFYQDTSTESYGTSIFPVTMRTKPSVTATISNTFYGSTGFTPNSSATTLDQAGANAGILTIYGTGGTAGKAGRFMVNNLATCYVIWSAEL